MRSNQQLHLPGHPTILSSGFPTFDKFTGGLGPGLTVCADRNWSRLLPTSIVAHAGVLGPSTGPVLVITNHVDDFSEYLVMALARIEDDDSTGLEPRKFDDDELGRLNEAREKLANSRIMIEKPLRPRRLFFGEQIRQWVQRTGGGLVVVCASASEETSQLIKSTAEEYGVAILAIVKLAGAVPGGFDVALITGTRMDQSPLIYSHKILIHVMKRSGEIRTIVGHRFLLECGPIAELDEPFATAGAWITHGTWIIKSTTCAGKTRREKD